MAEQPLFAVEGLYVSVEGKEILKGVELTVNWGEIHALMGPNGSGKSTLANCLLGHPRYVVTAGRVLFKGEDVTKLTADARARKGCSSPFSIPWRFPA